MNFFSVLFFESHFGSHLQMDIFKFSRMITIFCRIIVNLHLHYVNETSVEVEIPGLRTCESNSFPRNKNCRKIDQNLHDSIEFNNPQSGLTDISSLSKSDTGRPIINVIIENHKIFDTNRSANERN